MRSSSLARAVLAWGLPLVATAAGNSSCDPRCRRLPGDELWPSPKTWSSFNKTIGGRLVATVPLGEVCHGSSFDDAECADLQSRWTLPETHLPSSSSVMQPFFANESCDPFTSQSTPCTLGNYVSYAVNVSTTAHVQAALLFAQAKNIRVVIRNTGHDFLGRSTGAGALAIWTHHLKTTEITTYSDDIYSGPALRAGAGVLGAEAVAAADPHGLVVVTGECTTVGLAGGYTQGGGHSALSTNFGLAADQALEFRVVTAQGRVVRASRRENSDLFWALTGGGGGTYGVVTEIVVRAHPAGLVGGGTVQLAAAYTTTEAFNKAVAKLHSLLPSIIDQGASVIYYVSNQILVINPITVLNSTGEDVRDTILAPFLATLKELGIPSTTKFTTLSYLDHYNTYMGPLPYGHVLVEEYQFGSRLIPRSLLENDNDAFQSALQNLTANGVLAVGSASAYTAPRGVSNSVLPAWRSALIQMQLTTPWDPTNWAGMLAEQKRITDDFNPQLAELTPTSGAYMNEADFNEPNWKETWFGVNYERLRKIKSKWDPESVFYIFKGVGSEDWNVDASGRMCHV